jgi:hypothetical protein
MISLEGLSLYFPMLLQRVTQTAQMEFDGARRVSPLLLLALLVLGFITLIFAVQFAAERMGAVYGNR